MKSILITGASGFVGTHLAIISKSQGIRVVGIGLSKTPKPESFDEYIVHDLSESVPLLPNVDAVVHLAGLSAVGPSFSSPQRYLEVNSRIVTGLCEHYLRTQPAVRFVGVSSGSVYGPQSRKLKENDVLSAHSPYAVSKILLEAQIAYYANLGLNAVVARPFNHIGPGQGAGFLVADLYEKLKSNSKKIEVGNLDSVRDYCDVRDVCLAYLELCRNSIPGVFNVCSGVGTSGKQVLEMLCQSLDIALPEVEQRNRRPTDQSTVIGSHSAINSATGWSPAIGVTQSIAEFVQQKLAWQP